jgi:hypothetical protein
MDWTVASASKDTTTDQTPAVHLPTVGVLDGRRSLSPLVFWIFRVDAEFEFLLLF